MPPLPQLKNISFRTERIRTGKGKPPPQGLRACWEGRATPLQEGLIWSPHHSVSYQHKPQTSSTPMWQEFQSSTVSISWEWEYSSISDTKFLSFPFFRHWSPRGGCHWMLVVNLHGWQRTWRKTLIIIISLTVKFSPRRNEKLSKKKGQKITN